MANFDWLGTLINWFPMLLLVGAWFVIMAKMRSGPFSKYQKDCLALTERQVVALERIAALLEKRP